MCRNVCIAGFGFLATEAEGVRAEFRLQTYESERGGEREQRGEAFIVVARRLVSRDCRRPHPLLRCVCGLDSPDFVQPWAFALARQLIASSQVSHELSFSLLSKFRLQCYSRGSPVP
jgi:hypothetical protein